MGILQGDFGYRRLFGNGLYIHLPQIGFGHQHGWLYGNDVIAIIGLTTSGVGLEGKCAIGGAYRCRQLTGRKVERLHGLTVAQQLSIDLHGVMTGCQLQTDATRFVVQHAVHTVQCNGIDIHQPWLGAVHQMIAQRATTLVFGVEFQIVHGIAHQHARLQNLHLVLDTG